MDYLKKLQKDYKDNTDLTIRNYKISKTREVDLVFLETVASNDKINDLVLKNLVNIINLKTNPGDLNELIAGSNCVHIKKYDEIEFYLVNGYVIVIENNDAYAVEARLNVFRSVSSPQVQTSINGPKDAFVENYLMNVGLIKRRIKSKSLKNKSLIIGRKTKTFIGIFYIEDITDMQLVNNIYEKISNIDIDGILDSSQLANLISGESRTIFPTIKLVERPDSVSKSLLEGKVAIVVDNSTFVLITPAFFIDFINPESDNYAKSINTNFLKTLRLIAFFFTTMGPGLYIAIVNYNQEAFPTNLILNFAAQREGLPFPAFLEAFIILFLSEILRESDLRFPSTYGSSISILGALVLGDAAVSAGIVSPIMIIIISLSYISSMMFTEVDMINATRYYRFLFLIAATFFGLYGWILIIFLLLIELSSTYILGKPYTTPIAPFDRAYFSKTFFKVDEFKDKHRSTTLVKENNVREK
ncbi:MAG: spore germination protein [bacterium]